MKHLLLQLFLLFVVNLSAQVGINTKNPQALLDVNGSVRLDGMLYLEAPGAHAQIRGSKLLVNTSANTIAKYDIERSKYGPINYAQMAFMNTSTNGLQNYDTKISTSDYEVIVQGHYFTGPNGTTNIMPHTPASLTTVLPGYQIYAYKNSNTNTWFIKAFFNNATFRSPNSGGYVDSRVNIYLNLVIFRKEFLTKVQQPMEINMLGSETITAPLPPGF